MIPQPTYVDPDGTFLVKQEDFAKALRSHLTPNQMMLWTYLNAATHPSTDLGEIARQIGCHPKAVRKGLGRLRKLGLLDPSDRRDVA